MKRWGSGILVSLVVGLGAGGCASLATPPQGQWRPALDQMAVNAAVRQQTLYEADFRAGSAELSELGLARLARIVRQAQADVPYVFVAEDGRDPALTEARVDQVRQRLDALTRAEGRLQVTAAPVPEWPQSGEEGAISAEGVVKAFARSRATCSGSSKLVLDVGPSDSGDEPAK